MVSCKQNKSPSRQIDEKTDEGWDDSLLPGTRKRVLLSRLQRVILCNKQAWRLDDDRLLQIYPLFTPMISCIRYVHKRPLLQLASTTHL